MKKPNLRAFNREELAAKADSETYLAKTYFKKRKSAPVTEEAETRLLNFCDLHEDELFLAGTHPKYVI